MESPKYILDPELLTPLAEYPLFYPSSGNDFDDALALFAPTISTFWFADIHTYRDIYNLPKLRLSNEYKFLDREVKEAISVYPGRRSEWQINPMLCTERFFHTESGRTITIHRRFGSGPWALRTLYPIGIFFHRGDSHGDGGSGCPWFMGKRNRTRSKKEWLVDRMLSHLVNGGLVATDGSNTYWGEYEKPLALYYPNIDADGNTAFQEAQTRPFTDVRGNYFECVGLAGNRYGPTLIWRVTKPTDGNSTK